MDTSIDQKIEKFTVQVEDFVDTYLAFLKPYVPQIARFLIVATFYEDSIRIWTQWDDQVFYLWNYRHYWSWFVKLFLVVNITVMLSCSTMLIARKQSGVASAALATVVFFQGIIYGLFFEPSFLLRNLSVVGGLVLAFSDSIVRDKRSLSMPGLPMMEYKDNKKYFLLAGRVLLVLLFAGFAFNSSWSFGRFLLVLVGFVSCISVAVGYKAKFSAVALSALLMFYNFAVNHYWSYSYQDSRRDFLRYEYFQTLSIIGGLLIMVTSGAGELSFDEKKKIY